MNGAWFISDTHFGHENIIHLSNRPFDSLLEMDKQIIDNWNATVGKNDIVFHLGDFSMGVRSNVRKYLSQLNGKIILIRGNHDRSLKWLEKQGFYKVFNEYKISNKLLTHKPRMNLKHGIINYHGHTHGLSSLDPKFYKDFSCEVIQYTPIWKNLS